MPIYDRTAPVSINAIYVLSFIFILMYGRGLFIKFNAFSCSLNKILLISLLLFDDLFTNGSVMVVFGMDSDVIRLFVEKVILFPDLSFPSFSQPVGSFPDDNP